MKISINGVSAVSGASRLTLAVAIAAVALGSGCSSGVATPKPIKPDDYQLAKAGTPVQTDNTAFVADSTYQVPAISQEVAAQPVGKALDIKPPALVLTIPDGTRPGKESDQAAILQFGPAPGQPQDLETLSQQLWRALSDFSRQPGIQSLNADAAAQRMSLEVDESKDPNQLAKLFGKKKSELVKQFDVNMVPAVESSGFQTGWQIEVRLTDVVSSSDDMRLDNLSKTEQLRLETALLNRFSGYYQTLMDDLRDARVALSGRIELTLSEDRSGVPAFIADNSFDPVWKRLPEVLEQMNFKVRDRNRALGTYYVEYDPPLMKSVGLFGKKKEATDEEIKLKQTDYEVQLGDIGDTTSITFHSDGGKPLSREELDSFYTQFSQLMRNEKSVAK